MNKLCVKCGKPHNKKSHNAKYCDICKIIVTKDSYNNPIGELSRVEYKRKWNKEHKKQNVDLAIKRRRRNQMKLADYKLNKKCSKCGWKKHPLVLQFHHTKEDKKFGVGNYASRSWKTIYNEIKKCILLCPNCHTWLHSTFNKKKPK